MPTWEVMVVDLDGTGTAKDEQEALNKFPDWEFVTILPLHLGQRAYFKRQVEELELPEVGPEKVRQEVADPPPPTTKPLKSWQSPITEEDLPPAEQNRSWWQCKCRCHNSTLTVHRLPCGCTKCEHCGLFIAGSLADHVQETHIQL